MRFEGVDVPPQLLRAQEDGSLVVFAGAGVSTPSPSNYPDFKKLASRLSRAGPVKQQRHEPLDRFLGRLADAGVPVHRRTKELLSAPDSRPNRLHQHILELFTDVTRVKLVTTNFDPHFSTAAKAVFGESPEQFSAPALPWGGNFSGIVHLHGSVQNDAARLVLTDRDFGRAYLTEGWAIRFLAALFESATVLFVGYSHDDPIMAYVSRALPPTSTDKRFALTGDPVSAKWRHLGITQLSYSAVDNHAQLRLSLASWSAYTRCGFLDHEARIAQVVGTEGPLRAEDEDYLRLVLQRPALTRFFVANATKLRWLDWADRAGLLDSLFGSGDSPSDCAAILASWVAQMVHRGCAPDVVRIASRDARQPGNLLWREIAGALWRSQDDRPKGHELAALVALLIAAPWPLTGGKELSFLLSEIAPLGNPELALILFDELTRPYLGSGREFAATSESGEHRPDAKVVLRGDDYQVREAWARGFKPELDNMGESVLPILERNLERAHFLLRSVGNADELFDPMSFNVDAIAEDSEDEQATLRRLHPPTLLVDCARDALEWVARRRPSLAKVTVDRWIGSGIPLLRRLAVHGVTRDPHRSRSDKLNWALRHRILFAAGLKTEVFDLLREAFPRARRGSQRRIVMMALRGRASERDVKLPRRTRRYETYNVLVWLKKWAPGNRLVSDALESVKGANPDFRPREQPDRDFSILTAWGGRISPLSVEELLQAPPDEHLQTLLEFDEDTFEGPDRRGLLEALAGAAQQNPNWAFDLVSVLFRGQQWKDDVWAAVLLGLGKSEIEPELVLELLRLLVMAPGLEKIAPATVSFLEAVEKQGDRLGSGPALDAAERLTAALFAAVCTDDSSLEYEWDDWLMTAINSVGGRLALGALRTLELRRKLEPSVESELPGQYRSLFEDILAHPGGPGVAGRVVLASQLHWLLSFAPGWTEAYVLPMFNWRRADQAEQAWQGFLGWGKLSEAAIRLLGPQYAATAKRTDRLGRQRERLVLHLAGLAFFPGLARQSRLWFKRALTALPERELGPLEEAIRNVLAGLSPEGVTVHWRRWLERYWEDRLAGNPRVLTDAEAARMSEWLPHLEPVLGEAAELAMARPVSGATMAQTRLYTQFKRLGLAERQPIVIARLLKHLLTTAESPFYWMGEVVELVKQLRSAGANATELRPICDELARLGLQGAATLLPA